MVIDAHKRAGGRVAAVFPIHAPRAILRAFGVLPVECWGPPVPDTSSGDAHLQSWTCSIVRCGLSALLDGRLDVADILVVPHACDALQGLGSLLLDLLPPRQPVIPFYLPRCGGDAAFLAEELRAVAARLAEITGLRPTDADLRDAVLREETADAALARLLDARPRIPLSNVAFQAVVRSREYVPSEMFPTLVEAALALPDPPPTGIPVLLSGLVPEPAGLLTALDEAGALVVADDLASSGRRRLPAGGSTDPYLRAAESILDAPPCSTRGSDMAERVHSVVDLARRAGVRAAILAPVKFCEPELYYVPVLRKGLEDAGIRTLVLEVEIHVPLPHQAITRIQALLESVG